MREFQRKRKIWRFLYSRVILLALLLALIYLLKQTWGAYGRQRESAKVLERAQEELAALQARRTVLAGKLVRLRSPEGIEEEIREQFQVAKPGERMVVIVPGTSDEAVFSESKQSFVSRLFDMFR